MYPYYFQKAPLFGLLFMLTVCSIPDAEAKICRKGIPCGDTCIAATKTCAVGRGSAIHVSELYAQPAAATPEPETARFRPKTMDLMHQLKDLDEADEAEIEKMRSVAIEQPQAEAKPKRVYEQTFDPESENEKILKKITSNPDWKSCFQNMASGRFSVELFINKDGNLKRLNNDSDLSTESISCLRRALSPVAFAKNVSGAEYSYIQKFRK